MHKKLILAILISIITLICITAILLFSGVIWFNNPSKTTYPVRGVDVSSYQGEINWSELSRQGVSFAYIKATEGSTYKDSRFIYNWKNAAKTNLRIGAYHFFSFDSVGIKQAENFINSVPKTEGMLPPVVDVELYGDKEKHPPKSEDVTASLAELLNALEAYYGTKPVLYATEESYNLYIKNKFDNYDLWIRNVLTKPSLPQNKGWTFWQYSHRETMKGYHGKEKYIDVNVFNGTNQEFLNY